MEPRINNGHQQAKKNSAVLMGDRINEGFFTRKCMALLLGGQKMAVITR